EQAKRAKRWPQTPEAVRGELRRLAPALRALGYGVAFGGSGRARRRLTLTPAGIGAKPSPPTPPPPAPGDQEGPADSGCDGSPDDATVPGGGVTVRLVAPPGMGDGRDGGDGLAAAPSGAVPAA